MAARLLWVVPASAAGHTIEIAEAETAGGIRLGFRRVFNRAAPTGAPQYQKRSGEAWVSCPERSLPLELQGWSGPVRT